MKWSNTIRITDVRCLCGQCHYICKQIIQMLRLNTLYTLSTVIHSMAKSLCRWRSILHESQCETHNNQMVQWRTKGAPNSDVRIFPTANPEFWAGNLFLILSYVLSPKVKKHWKSCGNDTIFPMRTFLGVNFIFECLAPLNFKNSNPVCTFEMICVHIHPAA